MLKELASTVLEWSTVDVTYLEFDATKGNLLRQGTLDRFDAVGITGSGTNELYYAVVISRKRTKDTIGCSAFERYSWITELRSFLARIYALLSSSSKNFLTNNLEVYKHKPNIPLFGSYFGHQILCQALFKVRIPLETVTALFYFRFLTFADN